MIRKIRLKAKGLKEEIEIFEDGDIDEYLAFDEFCDEGDPYI